MRHVFSDYEENRTLTTSFKPQIYLLVFAIVEFFRKFMKLLIESAFTFLK